MTLPLIYRELTPPGIHSESLLGGKAANLVRMRRLNYKIPSFYVVTTQAFRLALSSSGVLERIAERLGTISGDEKSTLREPAAEIRDWIYQVNLSPELVEEIRRAHEKEIPADDFVAVRSSTTDEDARGHSFAGMHESVLFIRGLDDTLDAIRRVWASAYNERALSYRRSQELSIEEIAVGVIVQRMVDARQSGVMFTCHPVTGSVHHSVVSSLYGAGEGLVSQGLDADTFTVDKRSLEISADIAIKAEQMVLASPRGGLKQVEVEGSKKKKPCLNDKQVRAVVRAGLSIERFFGGPQDIEFCFDKKETLQILQSRPITNVEEYGPAAGNHIVWDNSNIIESYSGVTLPLTFSFIRRAYTVVYRCTAEVLGISAAELRQNRRTFENMLGLVRGRVYYNLQNWYRLVRLMPGYRYNARFMESMMGLKDPILSQDESPPTGWLRKWLVIFPNLIRRLVILSWSFLRIRRIVDRFQAGFYHHYSKLTTLDFGSMRPHELTSLYDDIEDELVSNWKAPIINDLYVMIFFGVLKKLCKSWCRDESGSLQNDLVCGDGDLESAEPVKMLLRLAKLARDDRTLSDLILGETVEVLPMRVAADSRFADFNEMMQRYLELYGFRCVNELKLEEYSLCDRPHLVYQVIRNYLSIDNPSALDVQAMEIREQTIRSGGERRAFAALSASWNWLPRKTIFSWVLGSARRGVRNRENMRLARTRLFGLLRNLFRSLGARLAEEKILDGPEDIFYLTIEELCAFVKGTAVTTNLRDVVQLRKREFDGYRSKTSGAPDDRFDTYGMVYHRNLFRNRNGEFSTSTNGQLRGTGCCPGVVSDNVKVVGSPNDDLSLGGEILMTERTDPGWVPLFPAVSGILIQRGSLLSHSAVVAREMGIPTIVGIAGLLETVRDGQKVRMDGRNGTVDLLTE